MTLTVRRLPADVVDELKARAYRNHRSLESELRAILTAASIEPAESWRCFHCGDVFTDRQHAREHFGIDPTAEPGCVEVLRHGEGHLLKRILALETDLAQYRAEDSDIIRWAQGKEADHAQALVRAEEAGYAKGVADMLALPDDELAKLREGRKAA